MCQPNFRWTEEWTLCCSASLWSQLSLISWGTACNFGDCFGGRSQVWIRCPRSTMWHEHEQMQRRKLVTRYSQRDRKKIKLRQLKQQLVKTFLSTQESQKTAYARSILVSDSSRALHLPPEHFHFNLLCQSSRLLLGLGPTARLWLEPSPLASIWGYLFP